MTASVKIRISRAFISCLEGSGPWQGQQYSADPAHEAAAQAVTEKIKAAPSRKDGSCTIIVDGLIEGNFLYGYADVMQQGAADNLGPWADPERTYLAEYNSGQALMRNLEKAFGPEVTRW